MAIDRGPWNALVDDDGSNLVGSVWNKDKIKTVLLDPIDAMGTWAPYTSVWSSGDGTQPALGNGVVDARYIQTGKWVTFAVVLFLGSTSTVGTGSYYRIQLPTVPRLAPGVSHPQQLNFHAGIIRYDGSVYSGWTAFFLSAGQKELYAINQTGALWGPAQPFTWAASSVFTVRGTYESS